jgi:hypothetical protein
MRNIHIAVLHPNRKNILAELVRTTDSVPIPRKGESVSFTVRDRLIHAQIVDILYEYTDTTTYVNLITDWRA